MGNSITIPGFDSVPEQELSKLLSDILNAVDAVDDADKLFHAIAGTRRHDKTTSNRNAITIEKAMEMASGNLDMTCRDLATQCRRLSYLLKRK